MQSVRKLGIFAGVLVVAACGGGDGGGGGSTTLDANQAAVVGEVASSQISGMVSGLTSFSAGGGALGGGFFAPASAAGKVLAPMFTKQASPEHRAAWLAFASADLCDPVQSDSSDSDSDGIPDDNTYTWNCTATDSLSGYTWSVTGTIGIADTRSAATGFGYLVTFTNFRFASTYDTQQGSQTFATIVNGTYGADATVNGASADQDVVWAYRLNGNTVFRSAWTWGVTFTPSAGTIDWAAQDMPAGSFTIDGGFDFSGEAGQDNGDWSFNVATTQPLAFDGSCSLEPPFSSGVIEGAIAGNTNVGFTITYTGCGTAETIAAFDNTNS